MDPIKLRLRKAESEPAYCYRGVEIQAMDLLAVLERKPRDGAYLFHGPRGGHLKPDTVRRILLRDVIEPLGKKFPTRKGEKGFCHGRLHSFRHAFCSTCANSGVPERMLMDRLGHTNSEMIRHY